MKKQKKEKERKERRKKEPDGYRIVLRWTSVILLLACGLILGLGIFGAAGYVGSALFTATYGVAGVAAFILPILILALGVFIAFEWPLVASLPLAGVILIILSVLALLGLFSGTLGGAIGTFTGRITQTYFGFWGAMVLLSAIAGVGLVIATDITAIIRVIGNGIRWLYEKLSGLRTPRLSENGEEGPEEDAEDEDMGREEEDEESSEPIPAPQEHEPTITMFNKKEGAIPAAFPGIQNFDAEYTPPPLSILGEDKGKPGTGDIKASANIIKRTFQNFGINVEMDEVSVGPTVTRYAIKPAEGVRLSKIISLQNNLELALAAHPVRIEAPIPGKSLVGIEVPNAIKATVGLGGILSAPEWQGNHKPLLAAIGRDIAGTPHYANIAKMPHGLVAGATGSGKSVAIHALITSLLYRNGPNQLRFIMIDPKRVELTAYNGIPHLLTPVITDPKKTILSLKWAAKEMERRYNILEAEQVRDIDSYHASVFEPAKKKGSADMPEAMPYIVIVIDELADIMHSYPRELEASIVRLAQMSRAVGIHLILSTQRPSVNVITGLIKANVPTRMALQVASQIDSRTILDSGGAEMLLGAGDMLYLSSDMQKPVRLQTAYISEGEVKKVVKFIKENNAGDLSSLDLGVGENGTGHEANDAVMSAMNFEDSDVDDDLYGQAKEAVEEAGRASTSYLQRKLRIGYSRAARLMDLLEDKGVIGPADGAKPREILSSHVSSTPPEDEAGV